MATARFFLISRIVSQILSKSGPQAGREFSYNMIQHFSTCRKARSARHLAKPQKMRYTGHIFTRRNDDMPFTKCACIETLYTELPLLDRFQAAKDDGFGAVEFWSWTDKDLNAVRAAAERAGIAVSGFNGDADFSLIDPAQKADYLAFLERSIAAAKTVGARSLTIHSNALGEGGVVVDHYTELSGTVKLCAMFDTLRDCAKLAEDSGIRLNLEALNTTTDHVGNFLTTTRMAAELTALVGSPMLKILYDVYHMQLNEGSLCGNIRAYGKQFGHVHVADAPGRHEPGTGEINYRAVYACLEEAGYQGLIGYELFPRTTTAEAVKAIMAD